MSVRFALTVLLCLLGVGAVGCSESSAPTGAVADADASATPPSNHSPEGEHASAPSANAETLHGIWEVERIIVEGREDGGEAGAYWIIRPDGSMKVVKRGRKPDGRWTAEAPNRLVCEIGGRRMLDGTWTVVGDRLKIKASARGRNAVFEFVRRDLKEEPTEPRRP